MFKFTLIFILCFLHKCSAQSYAEPATEPSSCKTPVGEDAQCLALEKCPSMVTFLNNAPKPVPETITNALQEFVCSYGAEGGVSSLICCPNGTIVIDDEGSIVGPIPPPPDVSNHKNLKYLPTECGAIDLIEKIKGGEDAEILEFPWMALLIYNDGEKLVPRCGGTIINEKYILTAAHCLVENTIPFVGVRVGEYKLLSDKDCAKLGEEEKCIPPVQHLLVENQIVHPEYEVKSKVNDIALIRVTKINMEQEYVQPVCLPVHPDVRKDYPSGVVTGWGYTDENNTNVVDTLQKLNVVKQNLSVCVEAYKNLPDLKVTKTAYKRLCLGGEEGKDSCRGDSGGPFHVADNWDSDDKYVQRGIVSLGHILCGVKDFPAIYTNVDYYVDWILDNIYP